MLEKYRSQRAAAQSGDPDGFTTRAAYLGGHPDAAESHDGLLLLDRDRLEWRRDTAAKALPLFP